MNARRARFRAVRARMTGEARRRRNANTGEQCTPWLYTHLRGWQIKVGGWADWSVDRRRGGAREHQSSRVFIVLRTRMDGTVTFFVYHSFDLGGDEVNSPRIRRARSRIALLRADYLFERILRSPTCTLARRSSNSWIPISLSPFLFFFFYSFPSYRISLWSVSYDTNSAALLILCLPQIKYTSIGPRIESLPFGVCIPSSSKQYPADLSNRDKARRRSFNRRSKLPGSRSITGLVVVIRRSGSNKEWMNSLRRLGRPPSLICVVQPSLSMFTPDKAPIDKGSAQADVDSSHWPTYIYIRTYISVIKRRISPVRDRGGRKKERGKVSRRRRFRFKNSRSLFFTRRPIFSSTILFRGSTMILVDVIDRDSLTQFQSPWIITSGRITFELRLSLAAHLERFTR